MRFYPRSTKSRQDACLGPGHIGTNFAALQTLTDRFNRYRPDADTATIVASMPTCYGGTGG